uniref:F-box associated beta-propeller type 1 domain-containing protein n=1 Tax=Tanacetum cinerariifolium TaxID=118510 RepID=A0A699GT00_TANCI|nr:hypothetical protein [Tanacetum cinerariifolium]
MVVIWNPSVRKYVGIVISNVLNSVDRYTCIGFGVCPHTNDPRLVKINVVHSTWVVEVFVLSKRVWKTVYTGTQFKSCEFTTFHVSIDGIIYWRTVGLDGGLGFNYIISFDLKREKFGEVSLSGRLARAHDLVVAKVNESLRLLEYYNEGEISVSGVWMMKDGVHTPFTKIYSVKVEGQFNSFSGYWKTVLGFRNNGEVVLEMEDDNDIAVKIYEPSSGRINGLGITNKYVGFSAVSYMESLLLLHESNSIIH